jgi:isopentenyl diphosphate isomerase/L-lactate dehydrogenase-like FMN-dependent dehydrogenase
LRDEIERSMALLGCDSVNKLAGHHIRKRR